jgi:hypothetical protein
LRATDPSVGLPLRRGHGSEVRKAGRNSIDEVGTKRRTKWEKPHSHVFGEFGLTGGEDVAVEGMAVSVHGDDGGEADDFELPDGFGGAEFFHEIDVGHAFDALGEDLGGAAHRVEINAAVLLAGFEGFVAHAAFADDAAQAEVADNLPLVGFFADGGGRSGSDAFPVALLVLDDYGAAVVQDAAGEADAGRELAAFVEVFVDGIAAGKERAGDGDFVTDFEGTDLVFGYRG